MRRPPEAVRPYLYTGLILLIPIAYFFIVKACGSQHKESVEPIVIPKSTEVWLFDLETTPDEAAGTLRGKRYTFNRLDTIANGRRVTILAGDEYKVRHLGIDWNSFIVFFLGERLAAMTLDRYKEDGLIPQEVKNLVNDLSALYGEPREKNPGEDGNNERQWRWEFGGGATVDLGVGSFRKDNDGVTLQTFIIPREELAEIMK